MKTAFARCELSLLLLVVTGLASCGGGSSSSDTSSLPHPVPVVEKTSAELAQICAAENQFTKAPDVVTKTGTLADERNWIRAYLSERYFWYQDLHAVDPLAAPYNITDAQGRLSVLPSLGAYFLDQLTTRTTASGRRADRFSFIAYTSDWLKFSAGQEFGYGWILQDQGTGTSRRIQVAHVYPATPTGLAESAGVQRGDEVISIDGVLVTDLAQIKAFNQLLQPAVEGTHTVVLSRKGVMVTVKLSPALAVLPQASHKVIDHQGVRWGYVLFNSHVEAAQAPLLAALSDFKARGVQQMVVDLRYNSGGYLDMASAFAYGVAGQARTQGKTFEAMRYNNKRSQLNENMPFISTDQNGQSIEPLGLSKIYVLTTDATCSASESFINGLRGVDVEVVQIGGTTCGKPYGFVPQDNCGLTYAAMEFDGVNQKGEGGYADGLVPQCGASDDLGHLLGDPSEAMFAVAIARQQGKSCAPASAALALGGLNLHGLGRVQTRLIRPEWQSGKLLRPTR